MKNWLMKKKKGMELVQVLVLIVVVLIVATAFKDQLSTLLTSIFTKINAMTSTGIFNSTT